MRWSGNFVARLVAPGEGGTGLSLFFLRYARGVRSCFRRYPRKLGTTSAPRIVYVRTGAFDVTVYKRVTTPYQAPAMLSNRRFAWVFPAVVGCGAGLAMASSGCEGAERPPRTEDEARAMAPVPACIMPLAARAHAGGTMRTLTEDQYWQAVFPAYDAQNHTLAVDSLTCTGAKVFDDPVFAGGTTRGTPIAVQAEDIELGNGGDRVRIAWLRTHRWSDGSEAGPLALVRGKEDYAEVYAVGAYRRSGGELVLQAERLGPEVLVTATADGCRGQAKTTPCEKNVDLFLPRFGKLVRLATLPAQRRAFATGSEPGVQGQVEYEMTSSPQYTPEGVRLFEQVLAKDAAGRVVHKTELERMMVLHDGTLDQGTDSDLWGRVFPGAATSQPSTSQGTQPSPTKQ